MQRPRCSAACAGVTGWPGRARESCMASGEASGPFRIRRRGGDQSFSRWCSLDEGARESVRLETLTQLRLGRFRPSLRIPLPSGRGLWAASHPNSPIFVVPGTTTLRSSPTSVRPELVEGHGKPSAPYPFVGQAPVRVLRQAQDERVWRGDKNFAHSSPQTCQCCRSGNDNIADIAPSWHSQPLRRATGIYQ